MDEQIQVIDKAVKKNWGELLSYIFLPILFALPVILPVRAILFLFGAVSISWLILLSITVLPICYVFTFYFFGVKPGKISFSEIGLYPPRFKWWLIFIVISIAAVFVIGQNRNYDTYFNTLMKDFPIWVAIIGIGIIVPFGEEIIFRGAIYTWFRRYFDIGISIISSALIFTFAILFLYPSQMIAGILFGCVLALLFEKTKSIWVCFALHALYNTFMVLIAYFNIFN